MIMEVRYLILIMLVPFLLCCSSDDNAGSNPEEEDPDGPQEMLYYLNRIDHEGDSYEVDLMPDHKVKKIRLTNSSYEFEYDKQVISRVIRTDANGVSTTTDFEHDADGKIISFSKGAETINVEYDAGSKTYSYYDAYGLAYLYYEMNAKGDLKKFTRDYDVIIGQTDESWGYEFDETKKGSLWNSNAVTVYVYIVEPNSLDVMLPFSKYPVSTVIHPAGNFGCENEFNEDDYITQTDVNGQEVIFNYTEE